MAYVMGALSLVKSQATVIDLSAIAASGGTGPYTYQLYMSTVSGFSPGGGNLVAGATSLSPMVTGLIPGTQYYFKMVSTDTGNSSATATSAEFGAATTQPVQNISSFGLSSQLGMIDLRFDFSTVSVQIDLAQVGSLYPGGAVKMVDSAGGVPKVLGCSANGDDVFGFINYDIKSRAFVAGDMCEISCEGNVMFLYATGALVR